MKVWIVALVALGLLGNQKLSKKELKKRLSAMQYHVTQEDGTEPPFKNEYWDNKRDGIYVDIVSGEALFSSKDKFKSGTGWPSFTKPLESTNVVEKTDRKLFIKRTEVRSKGADSHLGHVFEDGPAPTGLRYCINSASLRFVPKEKLMEEGYEKYASLFGMSKTSTANSVAYFAGGCFWCMEPPFEKLAGVSDVISGYMGGTVKNPSYQQVSSGSTGHTEIVKIVYDPKKVSYEKLLEVFWRNIDPLDAGGQFVDRGSQYRSGVFYLTDAEKKAAEKSKNELAKLKPFSGKKIATEITKASTFYQAEDYHQDYYKKNKIRYKYYRYRSGRDDKLKSYWGK